MRVALLALALACLGDCADPSPRVRRGRQRFTLTQVRNEKFRGHDPAAAMLRARLNYGHSLPPQLSRAIEINPGLRLKFLAQDQAPYANKTQQGKVNATAAPDFDVEFAIPVQIGTPPQTIPLNLDTGSADLWTFSSETYPTVVSGQTLYRPENSSTSRLQKGQSWVVKYGDGSGASGIVYRDRLQVGDTHVDDQVVQTATNVSPEIAKDNFTSGILGMANSHVNTVRSEQERTYIDNIKDSLEQPLFTANLRNRAPGNYNFGFIDDSEYTGEIEYVSVNPFSPFWQVAITGYQVGRDGPVKPLEWKKIVDTGTSLVPVPEEIALDYYRQVPGSGLDLRLGIITFPCSAQLPDFVFHVGKHRGRIPGAYINYGRVSEHFCHGGIQTARGIPFGVLGDVAIKAQFVVFNYGRGKVGFANKKLEVDGDSAPK